ncbi:hypothetical protein [Streptomyces bambusae]|uniref:ABM domain-containing protein n=1 Tax=Streptomyces bambusae TaxID=1550616 RepID=A0ABS6Z137_9ACTN|nr:hypothetical protein [Streptomyces bambusae]MBW5481442.1 hypothetical protein [Streptomyces bambusae]
MTATVTLMWEARAVAGRGNELLEWARAQVLAREPVRRETFRAPQDRVLVLTWWEAADLAAELPELPEPAADLITRPVHRWRFESVEAEVSEPR